MKKYRNYTDEDIIKYAKEVKSIAGLLKKLDLRPVGGNYVNIKRNLQKLNIDTAHWTGKAWNKNEKLKNYSEYIHSSSCKKHLIKDRGHICEKCKNSDWMGEFIPLEVHHLDGNRINNEEKNLQLLCPNCHALTDNYRNRKRIYSKI